MKKSDLFRVSLKTTTSNKLRTSLSMLWIIIGVITIILVVAIGSWAQQQIEEQFKNLSVNSIFVFPSRWFQLKPEAVDLIKTSPYIENAAWFTQGNFDMRSDAFDWSYAVIGITSNYLDVVNIAVLHGSVLDALDEDEKNILLGRWIMEQLYPEQEPETLVWTSITIKKKEYIIKWVLEKTWWWFWTLSFDDSVYMPISTYQKYLDKQDPSVRVSALVKDVDFVTEAVEDITDKIYEEYDIDSTANSIRVIDAGSSVAAAQANAKTLSVLLVGMATIVFIVSGIGIMNVMFASVAERTKEIGILKSIGADRTSILNQFLLESIILTFLWSLIGVVLWEWIIALDLLWDALPMMRTTFGDIMAVSFALITWIFFGWYPAWRASKLDPVVALRS